MVVTGVTAVRASAAVVVERGGGHAVGERGHRKGRAAAGPRVTTGAYRVVVSASMALIVSRKVPMDLACAAGQ